MDKAPFIFKIPFLLMFCFLGSIDAQNYSTISMEVDKIITDFTVARKTYKLEALIHIDCGADDEAYDLGGNSEDIGRIHCNRTYIQGADKTGWDFENRYFHYSINIDYLTDYVIRFSDADDAKRCYKVIINDKYCLKILHDSESSEDQPGGWKDFYIMIPEKAFETGKNKITFDHSNMSERSPAIADIWIYKIIK